MVAPHEAAASSEKVAVAAFCERPNPAGVHQSPGVPAEGASERAVPSRWLQFLAPGRVYIGAWWLGVEQASLRCQVAELGQLPHQTGKLLTQLLELGFWTLRTEISLPRWENSMGSLKDGLCFSVVPWSGGWYFLTSQACCATGSRERWGLRTVCCSLYEHLIGIVLVLGVGGVSEDPWLHWWGQIRHTKGL